MLSAFTAKPIVEIRQGNKSKIESLLAYSDRLLVGLNNGTLRVYRVNDNAESKSVDLLREQEKFSKYKIELLAIIKEAGILVSLSNGIVSIHDLSTYDLQETLGKSKGASTFAVTSNIVKDQGIASIVSRLAVAVKRRLLLWSWHDSEPVSDTQELTLVTGIKTLTWVSGTRLVAGLSSSYVLVDVETSAVTDIIGPGSIGGAPGQDGGRFGGVGVASMGYIGMGGMIPRPLATRLHEGELLLAKDINTHFINTDGDPLGRRQIPWAVAPEAIGYSYPFLLSLQPTKGTLEVRNPETLSLLQTISLPNATQLHVPNLNVSLAHAGKGFLVSSERCVWRMDALGYDVQIDALIDKHRYDEAISLLGMLEDALLNDKEGRMREAKMLKAQELFDARKYRDSLDLFTDASASPERVIRLYPSIISGNKNETVAGDVSTPEGIGQDSSHETQPKAPSQANEGSSAQHDSSGETKGTSMLASLVAAQKNEPQPSVETEDGSSLRSSAGLEADNRHVIEGKDLKKATSELAGFLVGVRTRLQRFLNPDGSLKEDPAVDNDRGNKVNLESLLSPLKTGDDQSYESRLQATARIVDTTLFRAYMLATPSMAGPLFRLPNFCDSDVVKERLLENGRNNDLIDFLFGKQLHKEALDLLKQFGQSEKDQDTPEQLRGPGRTVAYLQNLPPRYIDLILEYTDWPIRLNSELTMEIFIADTENAETLPRDRVVKFLQGIGSGLDVKYLEHVIYELGDRSPDFHQLLIDDYLKNIKSGGSGPDNTEASKDKLLKFLRFSNHYDQLKVLRGLAKDDPDLFEARAIISGNMGNHRQALSIYVFDLANSGKAEEYCNQVYVAQTSPISNLSNPTIQSRRASTSTDEASSSIYHILLSLYLSPPPPRKAQWGPALDILAKHGSRLPASSTLGLIPEVLPVQKLESYFTARIRAANTIVNESRIVSGLQKVTDISEEAKLRLGDGQPSGHFGRNRSVVITEERVCGVCHKRFGGSAIKVLPDNSVVHYGCSIR